MFYGWKPYKVANESNKTHFFRGVETAVIINFHLPLVKCGNCERSLSLRLGHACILEVHDGPTGKFEKPS